VKGLRVQEATLGIVSYALICIGIVVILSGLLVFGWKLHRVARRRLKEEPLTPHTAIELSKECMSDGVPGLQRVNSETGVLELEGISNVSALQSYDELVHPRASLPLFSNGSSPPETKEPTDAWSVSSASYRLESRHEVDKCWSILCTQNIGPNDQRLSVFSAAKEAETEAKNSYFVLLTEEDQGVLRQILALITVSAVVGGVDIVVSVFFALAPPHDDVSVLVLVSLYVTFGLEILASGLVLVVFTTTIKVRSKESLQFLAKVRLIQIAEKSKNATISAPKGLPHIAKRLLKFIGAEA
jgi:hypothetical protein